MLDPNPANIQRQGAREARIRAGGDGGASDEIGRRGAGQLGAIAPAEASARAQLRMADVAQLLELAAIDAAQVATGKPAKLLSRRARGLIRRAFVAPSNINPSNMPDHAPEKRWKTAIPAFARGSGRRDQAEQLQRAEIEHQAAPFARALDGRAGRAERDRAPKLSPRNPCEPPQIGIFGLYFIRSAGDAVSGGGARLGLFPCSQRQSARERPQKRRNLL